MYKLGARKVALFGLGQIGCAPFEISRYGTNGSSCVHFINNAVQLFNNRLKSLVDDLNNSLSGAKFIYVNVFGMASGDASSVGKYRLKLLQYYYFFFIFMIKQFSFSKSK